MKRFVAIVVASVAMIGLLCSCGGGKSQGTATVNGEEIDTHATSDSVATTQDSPSPSH